MWKKHLASLVFAASLLLAGCEQGQATEPTVAEPTQPAPTVSTVPTPVPTEEPTEQPTPTQPYRVSNSGLPEEFTNGTWQEVALPEIPESLQPTAIVGENRLLQVKVQLSDYEMPPDGLVIGEYSDGQWYAAPFAFVRSPEVIREALVLKPPDYWPPVEEYFRHPENGLDILSYGGKFLGMRLEVDESTGETRVDMLMVQRFEEKPEVLRIIKIRPTALHLHYGRTYEDQERYDPSSLSVATIAKIIEFAEMNYPPEEVPFGFSVFIITDEVPEDTCRVAPGYGPGFEEYCQEMLGNKDRPIKSAADFKEVISKHSFSPTEQTLVSGIDWWDDNLIKPISRQANQVHIVASLVDLTGSE